MIRPPISITRTSAAAMPMRIRRTDENMFRMKRRVADDEKRQDGKHR
jgi:hypothetical protein